MTEEEEEACVMYDGCRDCGYPELRKADDEPEAPPDAMALCEGWAGLFKCAEYAV